MFTGIVEAVGRVARVERTRGGMLFAVESGLRDVSVGDSVAVAGVCQTAVSVRGGTLAFEAVGVTLAKTTLGSLRPGARVNLERAARPTSFLGGHIVTGHVAGAARVVGLREGDGALMLEIGIEDEWEPFAPAEGSIAVDGASLTIAERKPGIARISLIPHTRDACTLGSLRAGDKVNVELDCIARHVAAMAGRGATGRTIEEPREGGAITEEALRAWGYR